MQNRKHRMLDNNARFLNIASYDKDMAKAWVSVFSVIIAIAVGIGLYTIWNDFRPDDEWYLPFLAGFSGVIMVYLLLYKLRGAGG